jgi:hypothetical protein
VRKVRVSGVGRKGGGKEEGESDRWDEEFR